MATTALKQIVASQLAAGHSIQELAERHGYSWRGMRRLTQSREIQELTKLEQERLLQASERTMFRFLLAADQCAEGMVKDAHNDSSPRQFEARKYILDRIVPTRSTQQSGLNVNLQITREVVRELGEALEGLRGQRPLKAITVEASPNLIEGKQAFADEDPTPHSDH